MSNKAAKKIGGEFGEVRATIDVAKLNDFLSKHGNGIVTPLLDVKQFKVSMSV